MGQNVFFCCSPVDFRYWDEETASYLSEDAFTEYKLKVEVALVATLVKRGKCPQSVLEEVRDACEKITTEEVYAEEKKIKHDIRALVNCIRAKVSDEAKPYVHMTATSYDIVDTANAVRYKDVVENVLIPELKKLEHVLISLCIREAETLQVGRTHGQHAVPITFGFPIAGYVSRIGNSIMILKELATELPGKFSGAVGAYNASSLFFDDPEMFEKEVLEQLGIYPGEHSTQVVAPEPLIRLFSEIVIVGGILANLSDDMRNLQRTEIGEVGEEFSANQVGSSTMPQKRNPINFENVKSCWKIIVPRILTMYMDQISEHQRDLTNSASARTYGEIVVYTVSMIKRLTGTMKKLSVDHANLQKNISMQKDLVLAEPLYILLAGFGHPDAHEKVRQMTLTAQQKRCSLEEVIAEDAEMKEYLDLMAPSQKTILSDSSFYTGIATKKAKKIAEKWKNKLVF